MSERGEEVVEHVRKLTGGFGVHSVLECVGTADAMATSVSITRPGGAVGRVGVPITKRRFFPNLQRVKAAKAA